MKNPGIRYGLIAIIFTITWTLIEHALGYNTTNHAMGQYTRLVPPIVYYLLVAASIYYFRKKQGGSLSFAQGFKVGITASLVYGILAAIWFAIYAEIINPQYQATLKSFERAKMEAAHASPEAIETHLKQVELQSGGSFLSYLILFMVMTVFGIIITVITTLILRKRKASIN